MSSSSGATPTRPRTRYFPIAALADERMLDELKELVETRREYLARRFEI